MKTEDFDDAIRSKLQGLKALQTEQDVEAVHQFVVGAQKGGVKKRLLYFFTLSTLLLVLVGLITWNVNQRDEIGQLKETLISLQNKSHTIIDSVLTTKTNNSNTPLRSDNASTATVASLPTQTSNQSTHVGEKMEVKQKTLHARNAMQPTSSAMKVRETMGAAAVHDSHHNETENSATPELEKVDTKIQHLENTEVAMASASAGQIDLMKDSVKAVADAALVIENVESEKPRAVNSKLMDTLFEKESQAEVLHPREFSDSTMSTITAPRPVFTNPWNYRGGIEVIAGNNHLGSGVFGEAVYNNRFVFSVGARMLKDRVETFESKEDYNEHKSQEFEKHYGDRVQENSRDFRIENTIYQVPIALFVNLPLGHKYTVITGIGTDLDIYNRQHVEYHHQRSALPNDMQTQAFTMNYPPVLFNNIVFSLGMQRRFGRFGVQAIPFVSPQLIKVDYRKEKVFYGLRLRAYYEF
jgi:PBP1b-binding outer membrane lipoprotein LpoB